MKKLILSWALLLAIAVAVVLAAAMLFNATVALVVAFVLGGGIGMVVAAEIVERKTQTFSEEIVTQLTDPDPAHDGPPEEFLQFIKDQLRAEGFVAENISQITMVKRGPNGEWEEFEQDPQEFLAAPPDPELDEAVERWD